MSSKEAAALWESLAMIHGFVDGDKRVGFAATVLFLGMNGVEVLGSGNEWIEFIYGHLEAGTFRKPALDEWLGRQTRPV